jgi:hypothetical protein
MAYRPRWIRNDVVQAQTQRTVDRQFLFTPDPVVTNIIGASAARAQRAYPVHIYWLEFNINHEQNGIAPLSDSVAHRVNLVKFKQMFHSIMVCAINKHLGREGGMFSSRARSIPCLDTHSVAQQFFYAMTNPVKDGLVDRVSHWKGFSSYRKLARGEDVTYTYPDYDAWRAQPIRKGKRKLPLSAFLRRVRIDYTPIPSLAHLSETQRQSHIRREVRAIEAQCRAERERDGRRVLSPGRLSNLDSRQRPANPSANTTMPLCHCSHRTMAKAYRREWNAFLDAYRYASLRYRSGCFDVEFPKGALQPPLLVLAA